MNFIISLIFIQQIFAIPTNDQSEAIFDPSDEHLLDEEAKDELEKIKKSPKEKMLMWLVKYMKEKLSNFVRKLKFKGGKQENSESITIYNDFKK